LWFHVNGSAGLEWYRAPYLQSPSRGSCDGIASPEVDHQRWPSDHSPDQSMWTILSGSPTMVSGCLTRFCSLDLRLARTSLAPLPVALTQGIHPRDETRHSRRASEDIPAILGTIIAELAPKCAADRSRQSPRAWLAGQRSRRMIPADVAAANDARQGISRAVLTRGFWLRSIGRWDCRADY